MSVNHNLKGTIQPVALRAPEVTLGIRWDTAADIWSAACVVMHYIGYLTQFFELAIGSSLFLPQAGDTWTVEDDRLAQMIGILGDIPTSFLNTGPKSGKFFNEEGKTLAVIL